MIEKIELPLSEAIQDLTVHEVRMIQTHYGTALEKLSGTEQTAGTAWAYMVRRGVKAAEAWRTIEQTSMRDLGDSFADEPQVHTEDDETYSKSDDGEQ